MKLLHNVKLCVFACEGEDHDMISSKLVSLCPFDISAEKVELKRTICDGFNEKKIVIFEIVLTKETHTNKFMKHLSQVLSPDQRLLLRKQLDSRLDSELNFFIRFDKSKWIDENELWITDCGNCFHIKLNIAAFPKDRKVALKLMDDWLASPSKLETNQG